MSCPLHTIPKTLGSNKSLFDKTSHCLDLNTIKFSSTQTHLTSNFTDEKFYFFKPVSKHPGNLNYIIDDIILITGWI